MKQTLADEEKKVTIKLIRRETHPTTILLILKLSLANRGLFKCKKGGVQTFGTTIRADSQRGCESVLETTLLEIRHDLFNLPHCSSNTTS